MVSLTSRFSKLNPGNLLTAKSKVDHEKVPLDSLKSSPLPRWSASPSRKGRFHMPRLTFTRLLFYLVLTFMCATLLFGGFWRHGQTLFIERRPRGPFRWQRYPRLNGFYNGIRTLVPYNEFVSEQSFKDRFIGPDSPPLPSSIPTLNKIDPSDPPPLDPAPYIPYPDYESAEYLKDNQPVQKCYLDPQNTLEAPDIYAYPGLPQNMTEPFFGSHQLLGFTKKNCFDRFGRLAPYGYGYPPELGGFGLADNSEKNGVVEKLWSQMGSPIDWRGIDWGKAQKRCYERNKIRFSKDAVMPDGSKAAPNKKMSTRQAFILRAWTGYDYSPWQIMSLRAMISELSIKSGGEYDVHLLVHVKDNNIPIWASDEVYETTLRANVPEEFWGIASLWSEKQMETIYPGPFEWNIENDSKQPIHGVYRGAHLPLQVFAHEHPEYDFFWNWEMDLRFTGHNYELNQGIINWAKDQPRKGLWERSAKYYIPRKHGSWRDFRDLVEKEIEDSGEKPIWGPVNFENSGMLDHPLESSPPHSYEHDNYEWGVGEEADLLTFNPLFDPLKTNWVFRNDVTGYNLSLPPPPRRTSIITVSRLSRKLLEYAHEEEFRMRHHMFPEMWPPTVAFHHGFKAAYVPHPIFFDREWPLNVLDNTFNFPPTPSESVFGFGEHNHEGSTFYYNSGFSSALWRRWLGSKENNEGGAAEEKEGSGRLCLMPALLHPIKHERSD
ncbi:hypothetical protein EJ05DRAFT_445707 [Pseudovirgaria hyperparasitica]|uniref:Major facilitator superfamily transporter n=1 Tax=Pseudovirgaria hyperparasitica TaxID=470096 RepID=A0A6A6VTV0_9PEZI|nr:uncharacterized protein EJ05DRAFT_445707 [Pseudovirgaria hyperparasitica]KAF2753030.1 hypothetical protein EJ05DRAFT_445707 [Pseudovirgaria hyperparasitica]